MPNGDKIQALYNAASKEYDLGDYNSFVQKLSDPNKRQALYNTIGQEYDLGTYDNFNQKLGFDSKEVQQQQIPAQLYQNPLQKQPAQQPINQSDLQQPIGNFQNAKPPTGQISNQQVLQAQQGLQQAKQATTEQKLNVEQGQKYYQAQRDKIYNAAYNTAKKMSGGGEPSKDEVNNLISGIDNGDLAITPDAKGNDVVKNSGNFIQSYNAAYQNAFQQQAQDAYLSSLSKDKAIEYLNQKNENPELFTKESDVAPTGLGAALGGQAQQLIKGIIGGIGGTALAPETGGASVGTFLGMAKDMAQSGYSNALEKNYNILRQQGLSDSDAFDKAQRAAYTGEAVNLGTGALLSGEIPLGKMPTPTVSTEGVINSFAHTLKTSPKVIGSAALGDVVNQLQSNAETGNKGIDWNEVAKSAEQMAIMHFSLGALAAIANGAKSTVSSYVRPQMENVVASADRNDVTNVYQQAENNGTIPQGTTAKVLTTLANFDEQKKVVNNLPISEEQKAAIAGKLVQRQNIVEENKTLKNYGDSFQSRIDDNEQQIQKIDETINKMYSSDNVFTNEKDNNTGYSHSVPQEEDKTQTKIPISQGNEPSNINNEPIPTEESKPSTTETNKVEQSAEKVVNLQSQIKSDANDIIAGKKVFKRFTPQEQRGLAEGGENHVEASLLLSRNERTGGKDNTTPEAQENSIEKYAKEKGIWTDNTTQALTDKYGKPIGAGEEAIVWADPENGKVIKTQDTFQYDNLQQKLDGITLHNAHFPEAAIKVLGFGRNENGDFQVIIDQPFIKGEKLTPEEIKNHLEKIGFKEDENGHFSNGKTIIEDLHTGNAIKTPEGNIVVIDPIMRLNTPEQGYGGNRIVNNKIENIVANQSSKENVGEDIQTQLKETKQQNTNTENNIVEPQNTNQNALQKQSPGSVLQHPQETTSETGSERTGMESGKQGDETSTTRSKEAVQQQQEEINNEPTTSGAHHEALNKMAERVGLQPIKSGDVLTPEEYTKRGQQLYNAIPENERESYMKNVADEFEKTGKINADIVGVAKAHQAGLDKIAEDARKKFGVNSKEFDKAKSNADNWARDTMKPMGTKFAEIGRTLQGETDLDTGNFIAVQRKVEEAQNKPTSKEQDAQIQKLTDENTRLQKQYDDLNKKNIEETDKNIGEGKQKPKKSKPSETFNKAADTFRKLKTKPFTFKDENGNDIPIQTQGATWNDLVELGAKAIEKTGEIADGVAAIIDQIKDSDFYKKLSDNDKQRFSEELQNHYKDSIKNTPESKLLSRKEKERDDLLQGKVRQSGKPNYKFSTEQQQKLNDLNDEIDELKTNLGLKQSKAEKPLTEQEQKENDAQKLKDLQTMFADKKNTDKKFTTDEAKALWDYAKKNYLSGDNPDYIAAIKHTAADTGLTVEQVAAAFETPKTKPISDAQWIKNSEIRRGKLKTQDYIENQSNSHFVKGLKKLANIPKAIATAFHGHIFAGTHYPMGFVTPSQWGTYFRGIGKMFGSAYNEAKYEKLVQSLTNDDNYVLAQRAGLANDVENTNSDDFEKSGKILGTVGKTGTRGFAALKWIRQQMFNDYYNKLPQDEQTKETAETIAKIVNLATGASNLKIPKAIQEGMFSANMEAARWGKIFRNPAEAAKSATHIISSMAKGEEVKPQDKVFLKVWGSRVGQQIGTLVTLLAANAAIQNKLNPKNPVNLTDPTQSDFLKLKAGNTDVDLSGGVLGVKSFLTTIGQYALKDKNYKQEIGDIGGKSVGYVRGKLSPLYGDVADIGLGTDYAGNPLPFSNIKPSAGHHKLSWSEYLLQKSPIFIADAAENMYKEADANGVPRSTTDKIVNGIIQSGITFGTGVRTSPSYQPNSPYSDQDKKDVTFKYFLDKGLELPNTSLTSEKVPHTNKYVSDLPQSTQQQYTDEHKAQLKNELKKVIQKGYVYLDAGDNSVSINPREKTQKINIDKLTKDQYAQILSLAQKSATEKTKAKVLKSTSSSNQDTQEQDLENASKQYQQ